MKIKLNEQIRHRIYNTADKIYRKLWEEVILKTNGDITEQVASQFLKIGDQVRDQVRDYVYDQTRDYIFD